METIQEKPETLTFAKRLKFSTRTNHDSVDQLVMQSAPFLNNINYAKFLRLQHIFHLSVAPFYQNDVLQEWFPGLADLPRLSAVESDLKDLGLEPNVSSYQLATVPNLFQAIGWLYCAEGSNIGAAFLYKETQKLNFDAEHGAKHLAAHPEGRAPHWHKFVAQLDALNLTEEQESEAVKGATEAFAFYKKTLISLED
ncbi:biliverdin-producing heme oxygenase [Marinomonas mediterranea]|uniref:biliverdin-producing heme oxygenase n=1 Tax=Marinomonas mediterranea TaxID=119864 RepID=UPI00234ABACD|nr:biliverdin-producing heme oxygenase [Marinomonas mediterranea]WCN15272.1 biliverdin-producing heme oxygenase [Marinomonas mediterranea]